MPNRFQWNSDYSMGNELLDSQHRNLLARCNTLADCIARVSAYWSGVDSYRRAIAQPFEGTP